jgi:hypothetical protein
VNTYLSWLLAPIIAGFLWWKWPYEEQVDNLNAQLQKANENLTAYRKTADEYKAQWDTFGKQMIEAADKVDPVAIKELFRKAETLEATNQELQARLANSAAGGVLFLDTNELMFHIDNFKGDLVVSGSIDPGESYQQFLFEEQLRSTDPSLQVLFTVSREWHDELTNWFTHKGGNLIQNTLDLQTALMADNFGPKIDEKYNERVTKAFNAFLQTNAYETPKKPGGGEYKWFLRDLLLRSGFHRIVLKVEKNLLIQPGRFHRTPPASFPTQAPR